MSSDRRHAARCCELPIGLVVSKSHGKQLVCRIGAFQARYPGRALSANSWRIAEEGFGKLLAMLKDQELLASCTGVGDIVTSRI